jgi:hypothetical protein
MNWGWCVNSPSWTPGPLGEIAPIGESIARRSRRGDWGWCVNSPSWTPGPLGGIAPIGEKHRTEVTEGGLGLVRERSLVDTRAFG